MIPPPPTIDGWLSEQQQQQQQQRATPVVVKMHTPSWSMLDMEAPESAASKASRGRNAKQLTWVLRLKAHRAVGSVQAAWTRLSSSSKPVFSIEEEPKTHKGKLHQFIRGLLAFAVLMLMFEVAGHTMGWQRQYLGTSTGTAAGPLSLQGLVRSLYWTWLYVRASYVAPPLQALADACTVLLLVQSVDKLVLCLGCLWIKCKQIRPQTRPELLESGRYPTVLCQIPMCNEREVYELSISAVCRLDWPRDRLLVQVLDDSSDEEIQMLIKAEVLKWQQKGIRIVYRHRQLRTGYKAGNLKSAMSCDYVKDYEYVAIFDADFQPRPEFLQQTVPHLMGDPELALVQARWAFVNKDDNLLTRLQNINLSFHFEVEQQVNGVFLNYFGFNGTAGVWRMAALDDCGGWMERTTVEDMDTAVRAHLRGWKFIFLNHVRVLCELPDSSEAYRKQQHRWHSGPMHLFRLCVPDVIKSQIPLWRKANLVCLFFVLRRLIQPLYTFALFCVILPLTMFVPESHLPVWVICYVPAFMSLLTILPSPRSFPFIVPYFFLENAMSVTKFNAMVSGLFQLSSAYEWVVTKKKGRVSSETDLLSLTSQKDEEPDLHLLRASSETQAQLLSKLQAQKTPSRPTERVVRLYRKELMLAFFLLTASARSLLSAQSIHFYFLVFQGVSFLVIGLDLIKQNS